MEIFSIETVEFTHNTGNELEIFQCKNINPHLKI